MLLTFSLKEQLDKLKTETQKENKRLEAKLSKLKNELKLYAREITIVDKKADSLAHANCKKYFQLWEYNKKVADDLIKKVSFLISFLMHWNGRLKRRERELSKKYHDKINFLD